MREILEVFKDAAVVILMAVTLDLMRRGGKDRGYRLVFVLLLLLM
jgi:hypothetical protein